MAIISAFCIGCSIVSRASKASAGGHEEQPSDVNNSTRTDLRLTSAADLCFGDAAGLILFVLLVGPEMSAANNTALVIVIVHFMPVIPICKMPILKSRKNAVTIIR